MKRSVDKPYNRSSGEMKRLDGIKYGMILKEPSRINPIFTERPHYGIPDPNKEADTK